MAERGMVKTFVFVATIFLLVSLFSAGNYAQEQTADAEGVSFSSDIAGITPDSFWYFLDFTHTAEEAIHEAGLMAEAGDYSSYLKAFENFNEEIIKETTTIESASLDGVTIENFETHEGAQTLETTQINLLTYEEYADAIEEILQAQVESGGMTETQAETAVEDLNEDINDAGSVVEERTQELIHETAANSDVSDAEVELVFEDNIREQVGDRFEEIASIDDVLELEVKIAELRAEADRLKEEGDLEQATAVERLLTLAESHGENCLNSEENNLETEGFNHLNAAENLVDNVERFLEGDIELADKDMPVFFTEEDIRNEIADDKESADKLIENYESLKEKYADNPERLSYIEEEKERAEQVQKLSQKLYDGGVINNWFEELRAGGLSEDEVIAEVHERFVGEYEVLNGHYEPPGLYVLPGDEKQGTEEEPEAEVIGIGKIEVVETIDPETGEVKKEIIGWRDGVPVQEIDEGGGFAYDVSYTDPFTGNTYSFGSDSYNIITEAGVTHTFDYPEGYIPSPQYNYNYGDEAFTFTTESGDAIIYSATGYEVRDQETEEALAGEAYTQEAVNFADGSSIDNEPTGFVFNDNDGEAIIYSYNPEFGTYQDIANGKVYVPPTSASHTKGAVYDPVGNTYKYNYGGVEWSSSGDGRWISSTGEQVNLPTTPAPVGYEGRGTYETSSGKYWVYDSTANKWTETTTQDSYVVAPNNQYRYDEEGSRYVDSHGNWFDSAGEGAGGTPWSYDTSSNQWVSSETGDKYDPSSGIITHPDGTVYSSGEGNEGPPCYGCYNQGGEGTSGPRNLAQEGGHYEQTPGGGYSYYSSTEGYQGPTVTTDSQGNTWTRGTDGTWTSPTTGQYGSYDPATGTYAGDYYTGGGGYDSSGNYVGGEYGNYDSSGSYTGGAYYGGSSPEGGAYTGGDSGTYGGGTTTGGGDTGGSTGGGDTGGSTGGYVVKDIESSEANNLLNSIINWFKRVFG